MAPARADSEAPRRVAGAVKRAVGAAELSSARAAAAMQRCVEETRRDLSQREAALRRARQEFETARAELEACRSRPRANCAGPAQAVARAESEMRRADQRVRLAREALAMLVAESDRFASCRRRLAAGLAQHSEQGLRELFTAAAALDGYLAGHGGTAAPVMSSAAPMAPPQNAESPSPTGNSHIAYGPKIARQMIGRDWTESAIAEAIEQGRQVPARNFATGAAAVRYVHPTSGRSVVVDTRSGEVIQVADYGFRYGPEGVEGE
jgi:hypothetical protein